MTSVAPPTYTVVLEDPGPHRLDVMRLVRSCRPDLGLAAAKAFVDTAPQVLLRDVSYYDVDRVRHRLSGYGAIFTLRRNA